MLRYWQGLGYYSRARNMHRTAQQVVRSSAGISLLPTPACSAARLGPYTAAAIASFAFDEAVAVLDGNVYRVLARLFGLHSDIAAPSSRKEFQALADQHIPAAARPIQPGHYGVRGHAVHACSSPTACFAPCKARAGRFSTDKWRCCP